MNIPNMPITIDYDRGRYYPKITCEVCQQTILSGQGNACWAQPESGAAVGVFYTHKKCTTIFDKLHNIRWLTDELDNHLIRLYANLHDEIATPKGLEKNIHEKIYQLIDWGF